MKMISADRLRTPRRVLVLLGVIGLIGLGAVTPKLWPPSAESVALADVIRRAESAELSFESLPVGYRGPGSSAETVRPALDDVQTELARYYVGTLLARKVAEHEGGIQALAEAGGGDRIGGVKTLDVKDVHVSGQAARVRARVTLWFKTAQFWYQPVTSQPAETNIVDLDLHLVRDAGGWKIDEEHWQIAPGGGPLTRGPTV
jgi:hypothetical protein